MAGPNRESPSRPAVKLTYDDFVHFPDDGRRHELIDGKHYVTPSPNLRHQRIAGHERAGVSEYWVVDPEIDVVRSTDAWATGSNGQSNCDEMQATP